MAYWAFIASGLSNCTRSVLIPRFGSWRGMRAKPLSMNAYKIPLTKAVVKRALLRTTNQKGYWEEA